MAHHAAVYTPSELPVANAVQELGFNYDDPLATIFAVAEFSLFNAAQQAEWQDKGLVYLGAYATPAYVIFCREPIRTLDERGILHSIASRNDHDHAMAKVREFGLEEYFLHPQIGN